MSLPFFISSPFGNCSIAFTILFRSFKGSLPINFLAFFFASISSDLPAAESRKPRNVSNAGFQTVKVDSVNKFSTIDSDGPAGVNSFMAGAYGTGYCAQVLFAGPCTPLHGIRAKTHHSCFRRGSIKRIIRKAMRNLLLVIIWYDHWLIHWK